MATHQTAQVLLIYLSSATYYTEVSSTSCREESRSLNNGYIAQATCVCSKKFEITYKQRS